MSAEVVIMGTPAAAHCRRQRSGWWSVQGSGSSREAGPAHSSGIRKCDSSFHEHGRLQSAQLPYKRLVHKLVRYTAVAAWHSSVECSTYVGAACVRLACSMTAHAQLPDHHPPQVRSALLSSAGVPEAARHHQLLLACWTALGVIHAVWQHQQALRLSCRELLVT